MVNFKIYDIVDWTTNNYNTNIVQYLKKGNQTMKFGQLVECNRNGSLKCYKKFYCMSKLLYIRIK